MSQTDVVQHDLPGEPVGAPRDLQRQHPIGHEFPRLLQRSRVARGWSKADLAKRSGFDPSSITRFEQGARTPERETVLQLAEAMALPLVDRDRLLAAAGFRSELWDDPLLVELSQVMVDPAIPESTRGQVRSVVQMAIAYCRLQRIEHP